MNDTFLSLILFAFIVVPRAIQALVTCASPSPAPLGSYKAGDRVVLQWDQHPSLPKFDYLNSINATLVCNADARAIATIWMPTEALPLDWVLPSVGNATKVGGKEGSCANNSFHIEYAGTGTMSNRFLALEWGPIKCGAMTILPEPNNTVVAITTTTTLARTSTKMEKETGIGPGPTNVSKSVLSKTEGTIIAAVGGVLLTVSIVAIVVFFRGRKRPQSRAIPSPWKSASDHGGQYYPEEDDYVSDQRYLQQQGYVQQSNSGYDDESDIYYNPNYANAAHENGDASPGIMRSPLSNNQAAYSPSPRLGSRSAMTSPAPSASSPWISSSNRVRSPASLPAQSHSHLYPTRSPHTVITSERGHSPSLGRR
ncbi:hypothetical protein BGZ51_008386 [Haplosporangium sp. Z 767]|nr:hypothetical protein BGZ51_008386 [Haplosporangium sp. Z 767]KAF9195823.1 hypothetical protein BGZ50_003314 [Haplosporangium sp. Z 11]